MSKIHLHPPETDPPAVAPPPPSEERSRLKILVLCHSPSWGGLEREVGWLAQALAARGHALTLGVRRESPLARYAARVGLETKTADPRSLPGFALLRLTLWIRHERPDLVHVHTSGDLRLAWLALALSGTRTPLYLTRHMGLKHRRGGYFNRRIYRRIQRLYAISDYVAHGLDQNIPVALDRIRILPPGIQTERLAPPPGSPAVARAQLGVVIPDGEPVIGLLGRITPMKGHLEFLEALYRIRTQTPEVGFQALVVGDAGVDRREQRLLQLLEDRIRDYGLADRIHLIGAVEESGTALAAMDLFVFPSHLESFGLALAEAMAAGLPVVACAAGGVTDIVEHERTGLLVPPRDVPALAQAILRLVRDGALRRRLGRNARTAAVRWDIRHIAARYETDFRKDRGSPRP